ncbi:mitochondrial peptide methionine sulfoxide reductase [Athene cunicularia]|uniref:mitochondrial peptide methionine sulfoxide reductase n=1 Tax=Athene cunicularia TaxID=194338 RepID=UPI000EF6F803|nr:mitochondrial peptide methionine sulfoxide reductase [Athene cunicularia]
MIKENETKCASTPSTVHGEQLTVPSRWTKSCLQPAERSGQVQELCSGKTGHTEAVRVVYQPENISFEKLLKVFWENHDPTQGMRQGNDFGTQYRSAIYTFSQEQMEAALRSKEEYQQVLTEGGFGPITTEIREAPEFYYAEDYHQQYLSKNPGGYCGLGGTGLSCPIGIKK